MVYYMIKNIKLINIFKKNLKLKKEEIVNIKKGKIDLELNKHNRWDSLIHVKIITDLEKQLKIKIDEKNFLKFTSLKKINKLIKKK